MVRGSNAIPPTLAERDAVVVNGVKYRVWMIQRDGTAQLKTSFGALFASVRVDELGWDADVRVWRPLVTA